MSAPSKTTISVERVAKMSARSLELLKNVNWGTKGFLYRTPEIEHEIERVPRAHHFEARAESAAVGTCSLIPMSLLADGRPLATAYYVAFLAVDPAFVNAGAGRALTAAPRKEFFDNAVGPTFYFGYIEAQNARSLRSAGSNAYRTILELQTYSVGWFRPRDDARVRLAKPEERDELKERFERYWTGHMHGDFEESFRDDEYFVLTSGGKILAGAQCTVKTFDLARLEGLGGLAVMLVSPVASRLTRALTTRGRRMLWWGHYFVDSSEPRALAALFEAVQARTDCASGLTYLDLRSAPMRRMLEAKCFGPHAWALPACPKLNVMCAIKDIDEKTFATLPFVASPLTSS